jgi:hypothetical protein
MTTIGTAESNGLLEIVRQSRPKPRIPVESDTCVELLSLFDLEH